MLQTILASVKRWLNPAPHVPVGEIALKRQRLTWKIWRDMAKGIDIAHVSILLSLPKKGGSNESILCKVPRQQGNQEPQKHHDEESQARNPGRLSDLRHQGIQNRQGLDSFP